MKEYLTHKQKRLLKAIPNSITLAEAGVKAGYAVSSRQIYKPVTKRLLAKYLKAFEPEQIKADIQKAENDFIEQKDNASRCRMLELKTKVACMGNTPTLNVALGVGLGDYVRDYETRFSGEGIQNASKPSIIEQGSTNSGESIQSNTSHINTAEGITDTIQGIVDTAEIQQSTQAQPCTSDQHSTDIPYSEDV